MYLAPIRAFVALFVFSALNPWNLRRDYPLLRVEGHSKVTRRALPSTTSPESEEFIIYSNSWLNKIIRRTRQAR